MSNESSKDYFVHPSSCIDDGAQVGEGTKIWHFCHVAPTAVIGKGCNIGQNVFVADGAKVGNNVKIQNNVSLYAGVIIDDDAFLGPSCVFTNVTTPRSHYPRRNQYSFTHVGRGATIGANATIVCGVTLGAYSFVGAGAVVTHDVPPHALVYGAPARARGWVCYCGVKLAFNDVDTTCPNCERRYKLQDDTLKLVEES